MAQKRGPFRLVPYFASLNFDRAPDIRDNPASLALLARQPGTRFVAFWRGRLLIAREGPMLGRLTCGELGLRPADLEGCHKPFLGRDDRGPLFGLDLSPLSVPPVPGGFVFTEVGPQHFFLGDEDAALAAMVRGLVDRDRDVTTPRIDLMALAMPVTAERVLLARGRDTAGRALSALSASLDPGETVEQAAARAMSENLGLAPKRLQYYASQPWPFPSALLMGFHVLVDDPALTVRQDRIADARWLTREEVFAHEDLGFDLPDHRTLAGRMLQRWVKCCDMFGKDNPAMTYPSGYMPSPAAQRMRSGALST